MGWIMNIYIVNPGDTVSSIAAVTGAAGRGTRLYQSDRLSLFAGAGAGAFAAASGRGDPQMPTGERPSWEVMRIPFIDEATLAETLNYLTSIYVFSYGFRADGTLVAPQIDDTRMIQRALDRGVRPILTLTLLIRKAGLTIC